MRRRLTLDAVKARLLAAVVAGGGQKVRMTKWHQRWFPGVYVSFEGRPICIVITGVNGSWWRRNLQRWLANVKGKPVQALVYDARKDAIGIPPGLPSGDQALHLQWKLTEGHDRISPSQTVRRLQNGQTWQKTAGRPGSTDGQTWPLDVLYVKTLSDLLEPRSRRNVLKKRRSARFRDHAEEDQLTRLAHAWLAEDLPNSDAGTMSLFATGGGLRPTFIPAFRRLSAELARQQWSLPEYCRLLRRRGEQNHLAPFTIRTRKLGCEFYRLIAHEQLYWETRPRTTDPVSGGVPFDSPAFSPLDLVRDANDRSRPAGMP